MGWNAPDPGGVGGYFKGGLTDPGFSRMATTGKAGMDFSQATPTTAIDQMVLSGQIRKGMNNEWLYNGQMYTDWNELMKATGLAGSGGAAGQYAAGTAPIPSGASSFSGYWPGGFLPTSAQEAEIRRRYGKDTTAGLDVLGSQQAARGRFSGGQGYKEAADYKTDMDLRMESEIERLRNFMAGQQNNSGGGGGGQDLNGLWDLLKGLMGGGKTDPGPGAGGQQGGQPAGGGGVPPGVPKEGGGGMPTAGVNTGQPPPVTTPSGAQYKQMQALQQQYQTMMALGQYAAAEAIKAQIYAMGGKV